MVKNRKKIAKTAFYKAYEREGYISIDDLEVLREDKLEPIKRIAYSDL